jgi:hypothetical protein
MNGQVVLPRAALAQVAGKVHQQVICFWTPRAHCIHFAHLEGVVGWQVVVFGSLHGLNQLCSRLRSHASLRLVAGHYGVQTSKIPDQVAAGLSGNQRKAIGLLSIAP